MEPGAIIEVKGLKVERGGVVTLDVPFLEVLEGEVLAIVGPNGAGKTTLLQTLAYLIRPVQGALLFRGRKVGADFAVLAYRRATAMAFQEPLLFDTTVYGNVASGLKMRGWKANAIRAAVDENLNLFGISHLKDRSARSLSGGEAQRTSLARAFATGPQVMLLDEPFASLDPRSRESLLGDVQQILGAKKTTTVFVTHDLMEAVRLADRIAVMESGTIAQIGTAEEVMNQPADELIASFVGTGTVLTGQVVQAADYTFRVSVGEKEIEATGDFQPGDTVALLIRPEYVTISIPPDGHASSARNVFTGTVSRITLMGFYQKVEMDCGFPLVSYITAQSRENLGLKEGLRVVASFKATSVHAMKKVPESHLKE